MASRFTQDTLVITDTARHQSTEIAIPLRDTSGTVPSMFPTAPGFEPSPAWGDGIIFDAPANPHNHRMMDARGRVWLTSTIRQRDNPDWCKTGSTHPSSRYFPVARSGRQISVYDPAVQSFTLIDSCYATHHLQFAEDAHDTLWFSGDGNVVGWLDTQVFDETGDERASQGWCPTVIDTNGDGRITRPWNEPGDPIDPARDTRTRGFSYGIIANPVDGAAWVARTGPFPGRLVRLERGDNPPETCIAEVYEPPSIENPEVDPAQTGHAPRGVDVDPARCHLDGTVRQRAPGQLRPPQVPHPQRTAGDRAALPRGLDALPDARAADEGRDRPGQRRLPLLQLGGSVRHARAGGNVPIAAGSGSDSLLALRPDTGDWVVLRVPYPLGFFARGLDGRIDDPTARLEAARPLGELRVESELAHRRRQGDAEFDRAFPAQAAPAGGVGATSPPTRSDVPGLGTDFSGCRSPTAATGSGNVPTRRAATERSPVRGNQTGSA